METNVYAPPAAAVMDPPRAAAPEFYVVSKGKFFALFFLTLGAYQLYWFYKHWARYRSHHRTKLSPAARTVFAIFFTHSLADEIDRALQRAGVRHPWSPALLATGYVVFQIIGSVCDRLSAYDIGSPATDIVGLFTLLPVAYSLWNMQRAANLACREPHGESNQTFTWANWLWVVLGLLLWGLVLLGVAMLFGFIPE